MQHSQAGHYLLFDKNNDPNSICPPPSIYNSILLFYINIRLRRSLHIPHPFTRQCQYNLLISPSFALTLILPNPCSFINVIKNIDHFLSCSVVGAGWLAWDSATIA